jgi:ATP synthase protein I
MNENAGTKQHAADQEKLTQDVGKKENRMLKRQREGKESTWFGLGMFGLIGWSVAIPTLLGIAAGLWLDSRWPHARISWTLTCIVTGVGLGCWNAWYWVSGEHRHMSKRDNDQSTGK